MAKLSIPVQLWNYSLLRSVCSRVRAQGQIPGFALTLIVRVFQPFERELSSKTPASCHASSIFSSRLQLKIQSFETLPEDSHVLRKEQTTANCSGAHLLSRMSNRIMILTPNSATRTNQEPRRHPPCISSTHNNRVHISHPVAIDTELNQPNIFFFYISHK